MDPCNKWNINKNTNPITNRKLSKNSIIHTNLEKFCESPEKTCKEFLNNQTINPLSGRSISESSKIGTFLRLLCPKREKKEAKKLAKIAKEQIVDLQLTTPLQCTEYPTVQLKDHQKRVCEFINTHEKIKGLLLFHSVGSGKTITAITMIRCILQKEPNKKIFVITPTSLVDNFYKEVEKVGIKFNGDVQVYSHSSFVRKLAKNSKICKDSVIIIDEAHNFKTKIKKDEGKRVKTLMKGTKIASQVFLLTATPIQNRPSEFANLYAMISNKEDDISKLYNIFDDSPPSKLKKLLHNKISYFKNEDKTDYPSVTYHNIDFRMTKSYYKLYSEVEENASELFRNMFSTKDMTVFLNGIRRAVNTIDGKITTPKIEWSINHIVSETKKNKKVLFYSTWLESGLRIVQNALNEYGIPWVEVNGSMSKVKRKRSVNKYNNDEVSVIFVSSAGAEGLDLKGTRSIIILEPHWNNEKLKQVVGRGVRYRSHSHLPPSQRHVDIFNLILKKPTSHRDDLFPSADQLLYELANDKEIKILKFYDILIESSI